MNLKVTSHKLHYRGFELGYSFQTPGGEPRWYAAWRSSVQTLQRAQSDGWVVSNVLANDEVDTIRLARECIDFNCAVESEEFLKERSLTNEELTQVGERLKREGK